MWPFIPHPRQQFTECLVHCRFYAVLQRWASQSFALVHEPTNPQMLFFCPQSTSLEMFLFLFVRKYTSANDLIYLVRKLLTKICKRKNYQS
jgi:hypothetical protein